MIVDPVTTRYTEAFFELASDKGVVDEVRADVERIATEVGDPVVNAWLFDPRVPLKERRTKFESFVADCNPLTRDFIGLLFEKNRELVISDLGLAFRTKWLASRGAVDGVVESALALGAEDIAQLAVAIGSQIGKEILLENRINSDLVGGVRVLVDNKLIDFSVKGRLAGLRRKMLACEMPKVG
jgi:F-type H+-transporting ATPase subunit delta